MVRNCLGLFLAGMLLVIGCGFSNAGERNDIVYENALDETILDVRVKYSTPYDEPRFSHSRIDLPAGGQYRIGVQGAIEPEIIIIGLATKRYVFTDLSGLNPGSYLRIAIDHRDGKPLIRRTDAEGEAEGVEVTYLTAENRPNAVDKDFVMQVTTYDELIELIREQIEESAEAQGKLENFNIEAGPIWNQEDALERCPEVVRNWSEEHGREARWTGQWLTTVPGEMSVCGCVAGAADEEETIFVEDEGWGAITTFPVFWMDWFGVGSTREQDMEEDGLPIVLRFRLPGENVAEMLNELLEDLRIDGFRPVLFNVKSADLDEDGDPLGMVDESIDFREEELDKWDAHDRIMEALAAAYTKTAMKAKLAWLEDEAFEKAKADGDFPKTRGVACYINNETIEVLFVPDGKIFLE